MEKISETISQALSPATSTPERTKTIPSRSDLIVEVKDGKAHYGFEKCLQFMEQLGKQTYGQHFKIHKSDHQLIYKLLVYITQDKENADRLGLSLRKGVMLTGPVGCGKTSLMNLLRFFQPTTKHIMKSCREISFEFIREGYNIIHKYSTQSYNIKQHERIPKNYCFDDLGTEQNLKYYGNECNVMAEILLSRYDQFIATGMVTHLTTNLSASEIENSYGNRLRSRMREMFNLIAFSMNSSDKRV